MSAQRNLHLAGRLARIKDRVADRARAELARQEAQIRDVENARIDLVARKSSVDLLTRPEAGETLDAKSISAGRWAAMNLERAIRRTDTDLQRRKQARVGAQQAVRDLAAEAERASQLEATLEKAMRTEIRRREDRALDQIATQSAAHKKRGA